MAEKQGNSETVSRARILPHQRISDAYRQAAAERLCHLAAHGYLDAEEREARCDIVLTAKTREEADSMFTDLQDAPAAPKTPPPALPVTAPALVKKEQRPRPDKTGVCITVMFFGLGVAAGGTAARITWVSVLGLTLLIAFGTVAVIAACFDLMRNLL